MCSVTTTITMVLTTEDGSELTDAQKQAAIEDIEDAIQNRIFGQGFLPFNIEIASWRTQSTT